MERDNSVIYLQQTKGKTRVIDDRIISEHKMSVFIRSLHEIPAGGLYRPGTDSC